MTMTNEQAREVLRAMRRTQGDLPADSPCYQALDLAIAALGGGEVVAKMAAIGERIRTQDNRITAAPIFIVQQVREFVADADYDNDGIVWVDEDGSKADAEEAARLEAEFKDTYDTPDGWRRLAVKEVWEFVTACFTEQGCKDYIAANGHNLRRPRIYADGSFRNAEWQAVRDYLASHPLPPSPQGETK
jgi:hypothetical protein